MIEKFFCKNFRNLKFPEIKLKKINLLVGPNGSGKSNFIDSIVLFKDLIEKGLQQSVAKRKFDDILNRYSEKNEVQFSIDLITAEKYPPLKYEAKIFLNQTNAYFLKEKISYAQATKYKSPFKFIECHGEMPGHGKGSFPVRERGRTRSHFVSVSEYDTVFRQSEGLTKDALFATNFYPTFAKVITDIKDYVKQWRYFPMSKLNLETFSRPMSVTGNYSTLLSSLENFPDFILHHYNQGSLFKIMERLERYYRSDFKLDFSVEGEYLIFKAVKNGKEFTLGSLSDGEIRILLLMTIFYLDTNSKVVFIDEPELNLHTEWLLKLRQDFYNSEKQLIISTHSADLLDSFTEDFIDGKVNILVFENGRIKVLELNESIKERFSEGYELGDLYRSGDPDIGGWSI